MRKKLLCSMLLASLLMVLPNTAFAATTTTNTDIAAESSTDQIYYPDSTFVYTYTKTITKTYSSYNAVPQSMAYREYVSKYSSWADGTLELQSAAKNGSSWVATYSGTMTCFYH